MATLTRVFCRKGMIMRSSFFTRHFCSKTEELLCDIDPERAIATLTINRPKAFNALNTPVVLALRARYDELEQDERVRCIVLTGSEKAFAAGADVKEMMAMDYKEMATHDRRESLLQLAMGCDILVAGENAKFGQPEVNLGIIAGAGGTQRLTQAVGKSLSMHMNLTGIPIDANRALAAGLVLEVVPTEDCVSRAQDIATVIASKSGAAVAKIKDCVNASYEKSLEEGLKHEHRQFIECWATEDQDIGMTAFANKQKNVDWKHR